MVDVDTLVIGSGLAGLTAARDLTDRGYSVLVLEARDRLGGRVYTRPFTGHEALIIEVGGAHLNLRSERNMRREIDRYGIEVYANEGDVKHSCFFVAGQLRTGLPVPVDQLSALERAAIRMAEDAKRISPGIPLADQSVSDLDVSIADYFGRLELPPEAHDFVVGLVAGWIQADAERTTVIHLLQAVLSCGGSPFDTFFGTFGEGFVHGASSLVEAIVAGSDLDVRFSSHVTDVSQGEGSVTARTSSGQTYSGATCVIAVPAWTLGSIAFDPPLAMDKYATLAQAHHVKGVKKVLLVENAPTGVFSVSGLSARFQWLFQDRVLPDGRILMVGFSLHEDLAANDVDAAQVAIAQLLPGARVVAVDGEDWYADPLTRGIVGFCPTGLGRTFAATMSRPEGLLAFAGAELTTDPLFWGWMEGAVESGHEAARHSAGLIDRFRQLAGTST
ncbi:MAG: FAD-dependent oxidoreductase [Actinobacteria bacterium]|uniref:Unannotated protein n=1 Tax=freshwater metagenome TaxID=449393 RepID=A0A6J7JHM0_9ZZZZ|nr:FAD-dependent oxidoreductase [Actinomycetota bacterium]